MNPRTTFRPRVLRVLVLLLVACSPDTAVTSRAETPKNQTAVTPVNRDGTEWEKVWRERHELLDQRLRQERIDLLLIGDSITHYWEPSDIFPANGLETWKKYYAGRHAVNLGLAGDLTGHLLWRLDHSNFEGVSPKVVVVNIGTNNYPFDEPKEIAEGIGAVVGRLRKHLPQSKILILGIFPRGEQPTDPGRRTVAEASRLAAELADGEKVFFLDIGKAFLEEDGTLSPEVMPDFLHLSAKGYEIWAREMEPTLAKLLGDSHEAETD